MKPAIAVIAHTKKTVGGGLDELRQTLTEAGAGNLLWHEVSKSAKAPKQARKAVKHGAKLVFVWGGDGMVQRCADALAGSRVPIAIVPAGTANLLATNLGIPHDLAEAIRIGLAGKRRELDLIRVNGEHFAVMAGAGFDAQMIKGADPELKERYGRLAYVWSSVKQVERKMVPTVIRIDGTPWFEGDASCVLLGNVGTITGGVRVFTGAQPDDGWLEVGVSTAHGKLDWARTLGKIATGHAASSPFVQVARGRRVTVRCGMPVWYELDGGLRKKSTRLKAKVGPGAISVCVP